MSEEQFVKLVSTAVKSSAVENGERGVEVERVLDVLKQLETFEVTHQLLAKTYGGKQVKKLCKSRVADIAEAARSVIKVWKARVVQEERQIAKDFAKRAFSKTVTERTHSGALSSDLASSLLSDAPATGNSTTDHVSACRGDVSSKGITRKDSVNSVGQAKSRENLRTLVCTKLEQLLESEEAKMNDEAVDSATAAAEIEKAIYNQYGEPAHAAYRAKFRSLLFNLKDAKNGALRQRILRREILAEDLVNLPPEDLANEEKKKANDNIRKTKLRECERGAQQNATTDQFTCGKCKASKCTYYQMQTRSADEPMTVFVTCTQCGNRWKC